MELSSSRIKKFLIFQDLNFLAPRLKNFLYFQKWNFPVSYSSYISGGNFLSAKNKKTHPVKISYISGNGTF